jgi:hypothetical protein
MVARDRFKYRFKISALRPNSLSFLENTPEISLKCDFNTVEAFRSLTSASAGAVGVKEKGGFVLSST